MTKKAKKFAKKGLQGTVIKKRKEKQRAKRRLDAKQENFERMRAKRREISTDADDALKRIKVDDDERKDGGDMGRMEDMDLEAFLNSSLLDNSDDDSDDHMVGDDDDDGADDVSSDDGYDDMDAEALDAEVKKHQAALDALKRTDPAFHMHLKKEGKSLLQFADAFADDDDDDDDIDDGDEVKQPPQQQTKKQKKKAKKPVKTRGESDNFTKLKMAITEKHSRKAWIRMLKLYGEACRLGDEDDVVSERNQKKNKKKRSRDNDDEKMVTVHTRAHSNAIIFCLRNSSNIFRYHAMKRSTQADDDDGWCDDMTAASVRALPGWMNIQKYLKQYLNNSIHLLGKRSNDVTMIRFIVSSMNRMRVFLRCFPVLSMKLMKSLLRLWSTSVNTEHTDDVRRADMDMRIEVFLAIRRLVMHDRKAELLPAALKGTYLAYVRNAKFITRASLPYVQFMANCVNELYALDQVASYQHAFVYIRQLAIHLRNAIVGQSSEHFDGIYNWQYANCLRIWSLVLASHGHSEDQLLNQLVYPLVQVCMGVLQLQPSIKYAPYRFHVARYLNQLSSVSRTYIPVPSLLIPLLDSSEFTKRAVNTSAKPPKLSVLVTASAATLGTHTFRHQLVTTMCDIILEHFAVYSYAIGYPELILPIIIQLQRYMKMVKNRKLKKALDILQQKLDANADWVKEKRAQLDWTPVSSMDKDVMFTFRGNDDGNDKKNESPLDMYIRVQPSRNDNTDDFTIDQQTFTTTKNNDDDDDGSKKQASAPRRKKRKKAAPAEPAAVDTPAVAVAAGDDNDEADDIVNDLVLSDSSDDADE